MTTIAPTAGVTIKLTPIERTALDEAVAFTHAQSRSDFVRACIFAHPFMKKLKPTAKTQLEESRTYRGSQPRQHRRPALVTPTAIAFSVTKRSSRK